MPRGREKHSSEPEAKFIARRQARLNRCFYFMLHLEILHHLPVYPPPPARKLRQK